MNILNLDLDVIYDLEDHTLHDSSILLWFGALLLQHLLRELLTQRLHRKEFTLDLIEVLDLPLLGACSSDQDENVRDLGLDGLREQVLPGNA